jgi:hypothetical protein
MSAPMRQTIIVTGMVNPDAFHIPPGNPPSFAPNCKNGDTKAIRISFPSRIFPSGT